jgi:hypothetical protein
VKDLLQIAGQVAGLAGIAIIVFLSIAKLIVGKTREVNQGQSFELLNRLLRLAAVITALGMVSWLISLAIAGNISVRIKGVESGETIARLRAETENLRNKLEEYEKSSQAEIEKAKARKPMENEQLNSLRNMELKIESMSRQLERFIGVVEEQFPAPARDLAITTSLKNARRALDARPPTLQLTMDRSAGSPQVRVTARTVLDGKEVDGYMIRYAPKAFESVDERKHRFSRLSSPTSETLPIGYYVFWVEKDGKLGAPTEFVVQ